MTSEAKSTTKSSIIVGDTEILTEIQLLPVKELCYYTENPRIFSILKQLGRNVTQEEIERKLWELDSTKDLYQDIKRNGGLLEEIIVRGREVLEGNSRLCAYRHLLKNAIEADDTSGLEKWSNIRARVLPKDTPDETIFGILGILHIRGKAEWRPYEQASYLFRQSEEYGKSPSELANQIGVSETTVKNMLQAYQMMEKSRVTDPNTFSYFVEFSKSRKLPDVQEFLPRGVVLQDKFSEWVKEERIPRAEAVRDLPTILQDKSARQKFMDGKVSFDQALEIAKERHPEAVSTFYSKLKKATEALRNVEEARVRDEIDEDKQKKYIVRELYRVTRKFAKAVGIDVGQVDREKTTSVNN
jgi:predicted transcriptional regulator